MASLLELQIIINLLEDFGILTLLNNNKPINNTSLISKKPIPEFASTSNSTVNLQKKSTAKPLSLNTSEPVLLSSTLKTIDKIKVDISKMGLLSDLKDYITNFKECSIAKTATNTVFGTGNTSAKILLVGEAPGAEEDLQGEPFVGRSGKLLRIALSTIGINTNNAYITNSVFWRPPGNRTPSSNEIAICTPLLEKAIDIIKPKLILAIGRVAANILLNNSIAIGQIRGRLHKFDSQKLNIDVTAIYHPAYLLRNPRQKKVFWFDLLEIKDHITKLGL